jgi:two-component system response regulator
MSSIECELTISKEDKSATGQFLAQHGWSTKAGTIMNAIDTVEILLVEDSDEIAELTRRVLKRINLHANIVWVNDGNLAVDFLLRQGKFAGRTAIQPRLVLLDLHLPTMSGHEVLKRIKTDPAISHIPVVMITTSSDERDIATSYKLGANSYLVKPIDPNEFTKTIADASRYWTQMNRVAVAA